MGTFCDAIGFVGGFVVQTTLDGAASGPLGEALVVNLGLLAPFALQHSVMARPGFKRVWTKVVPRPVVVRSAPTVHWRVTGFMMNRVPGAGQTVGSGGSRPTQMSVV